MSFKEALQNLGTRIKERKEWKRQAEEQLRLQKHFEDREKSANERELETFMKEEREEQIKEALDFHRKRREHDIAFNHNPLNIENITNHTDWEVLKERNLFKGNKNILSHSHSVLHNNPNLLKNNTRLLR